MNDQRNTRDHSSSTPWENEMTSEFDRRVRDLHEAPLTLDQVKGRATGIRRKRRAAVAGGVLAAAAVLVPMAVVAADTSGSGKATEVPPAATSTTTATDVPTGVPTEVPQPATSPAYVEGTSYHRADGSVVELPAASYEKATTLGDRVVAYRRDPEGDGGAVDVIDGNTVVDTYVTSAYPFSVTGSGETVGFVTAAGDVRVLWADGERTLAEGYAGWYPTAISGGPDCEDPESGGSACRVFLENGMSQSEPTSVDAQGLEGPPVAGALGINGADGEGRLAVLTRIADAGACGSVYDESAGDYVFAEQCDFNLYTFSPDSRYVLGNEAYEDGIGHVFAVVVDATTGDEVARLTPDRGFIRNYSWVDADTIAAQVFDLDDQSWSIQTLSVGDDKPATVVGPTPGDEGSPPFQLIGR